MRFLEALELAQEIYRRRPTWTIYAIGRFKPVGDITEDDPWKISVLPDGDGRIRVIGSHSDLHRLLAEKPTPPPKPPLPSGMLF